MPELILPTRVQRSRKRGAKQPPGTLYCGRPSVFANPFRPYMRCTVFGGDIGVIPDGMTISVEVGTREHAIDWYRIWLETLIQLHNLSGVDLLARAKAAKYLSCWCPLDQPCHVDVIIERIRRELLVVGP